MDIFMEGIPVYGTVSISATAGAGAWGSHGTFVEGRQGGVNPNRMADDTGNLVLRDTAAEHSDAASIDVTN
ncbi:hypothetical protein QJQ58_05385 [Paenibacillus dendritiformis]|uniref:hypothetical protein n=1 Tax=Paenibacillus dendritiformis TaxID=130049 RepID=UPI00248B7CD5|nr:hypothetical protein [Paenibacillus dendritiformis]WGU95702.1 hypothetical protein QJQ58_05385 [Paenibacillus dendritiformis]